MKPSEYLINKRILVNLKYIDELNKKFIDKEELKEEINKKLKYNPYKNDMCIALYSRVLKEILELIDK